MSDSYQAIYDAVRSRLGNCDIAGAAREAIDLQISGVSSQLSNAIQSVEIEHMQPSVLFRPSLSIDGNKWCALYGENLQDGVAGFGDSPEQAMRDFNVNWHKKL